MENHFGEVPESSVKRKRLQFDSSLFGSVAKEIEDMFSRRKQILIPFLARLPSVRADSVNLKSGKDSFKVDDAKRPDTAAIIIVDSDDEPICQTPFQPDSVAALDNPTDQQLMLAQSLDHDDNDGEVYLQECLGGDDVQGQASTGGGDTATACEHNLEKDKGIEEDADVDRQNDDIIEDGEVDGQNDIIIEDGEVEGDDKNTECDDVEVQNGKSVEDDDMEVKDKHDKGTYVAGDESDSQSEIEFDWEADIWRDMSLELESSRDITHSLNQKSNEDTQECDHSYIFKDDIGYVCRVCGIIQMHIESIIEFPRPKASKSIRTYYHESQTNSSTDSTLDGVNLPKTENYASQLSIHPRHKKQMKPHQIEGFNFLLNNLMSEKPGGCILAHAPGSGKTFLLISFIQSFMAKHPDARPLVILPRGILGTWKKEFSKWQIEDLLLLDMYSVKADGRSQQLEVLKQWANQRSILFLGYRQFSSIVSDCDTSSTSVDCQEILLTRPSILILDEGHTPRNKETNVSTSLDKVKTPLKIVLSGTLYHNHVTEVFNILNLVRPKFLKMENAKAIKKRILSMVRFEKHTKKGTDNEFYELVENTLLKDDNYKQKVAVITNLREMTRGVLHYYKGDLLDELPGLVDFTLFLKLTRNQKRALSELKNTARNNLFKISCDGSAIYVHPALRSLLKNAPDDQIDKLVGRVDVCEGVKAKFCMNMLRLCESTGEKLLVFSQYLLPLKFLVSLTEKMNGWSVGKQIFMITGGHDNDERELAMDQFNNSPESRVFFGSIKACGEGISLVGASRIIILDVHLNPSVTRQALGRAFRPGQTKKVYTYRLVAAESPEEADHATCFRKESIAKMWFEWNEYCGTHDFEMKAISVEDCGDKFLEASCLNEDISAISKRLVN